MFRISISYCAVFIVAVVPFVWVSPSDAYHPAHADVQLLIQDGLQFLHASPVRGERRLGGRALMSLAMIKGPQLLGMRMLSRRRLFSKLWLNVRALH